MLPVCEPGDSYGRAWGEYGFSRCFLQLVGSIFCAGLLYVLGLGAIVLGKAIIIAMNENNPFFVQEHLLKNLRN